MKLSAIIEALGCTVKAGGGNLAADVTGGYCSDLLSDVIGLAEAGDIWITLQTHQNIVAVASLKELAAILLVNNRQPDPETIAKADDEGIPVLVSNLPAFELAGRLYAMGIRAASNA